MSGFFFLAETNQLRMEAMSLFEECLTNGDGKPLVGFIEQQLIQDPPPLQLLRDLADDLQQRLLSLREYHFDVRERVVKTLAEDYDVDITSLTPPSQVDLYHKLTLPRIQAFVQSQNQSVSEQELSMLQKLIEASLEMAAQLHSDIKLTQHLHSMVLDWLRGISATSARQQWGFRQSPGNENAIRH